MNVDMPAAASQRVPVRLPQGGELQIEFLHIPGPSGAPLLIFLHEGLGSVAMWRDWPARCCAALGVRGLVYSRYGYGRSTPRPHDERWGPDYLLAQARDHLPALLAALGLADERPVLFGHSDGGSIALLYAALYPRRVRAIAVAAPHITVEDRTLEAIAAIRDDYLPGGLRARLGRYHDDPDSAFWAWNDAWLNPPFRHWDIRDQLPLIRCPVLAIQGDRDEYASLEQVHGIVREVAGAQLLVLDDCGHSPHREQPEALEAGLRAWLAGL